MLFPNCYNSSNELQRSVQWTVAKQPDTGQVNLINMTNWAKAKKGYCQNWMYIYDMYIFNNLSQCMCGFNITVGLAES